MPWTEITRRQYRRDGLRYASDMTDAEWSLIVPFMPEANAIGRPRKTDLRAVVNAILYMASTGCQWRQLPKEFPPYSTVQGYFYRWAREGTWARINHALVMAARERAGRQASPSAGDGAAQARRQRGDAATQGLGAGGHLLGHTVGPDAGGKEKPRGSRVHHPLPAADRASRQADRRPGLRKRTGVNGEMSLGKGQELAPTQSRLRGGNNFCSTMMLPCETKGELRWRNQNLLNLWTRDLARGDETFA